MFRADTEVSSRLTTSSVQFVGRVDPSRPWGAKPAAQRVAIALIVERWQ